MEIVDFLRDPGRYSKLDAQIPRGVLLSGQPGTGKTLLARVVVGEVDVPFWPAPSWTGRPWRRMMRMPRPVSALAPPGRDRLRQGRVISDSRARTTVRSDRSLYFPNGPWCFGPVRQTADATGASTGRARIWLSAAASEAQGSPLPVGDRRAMNRSGRTRTGSSSRTRH